MINFNEDFLIQSRQTGAVISLTCLAALPVN
jgi:hypothetical protein